MSSDGDRSHCGNVYRSLVDVSSMAEKFDFSEKICLEEPNEDPLPPNSSTYQSIDLINVLQQIRLTQRSINNARLNKQARLLYLEAEDIISCSKIEEKLNEISSFNEYLKTILQKKQSLLTNLQRPLVENSIKLELKYHSIFVKMLSHSANVLQNLMKNIEKINRLNSTKLTTPDKLPGIISYVETNLAQVNTNYHIMNQIEQHLKLLPNP